MLTLAGYSVDTVEDGSEALGLVSKRDYDFVFTDLKMPGMDGVEVTKSVRHLRPDIDVVVITGYATIETAVETVRYGAMDYIEKPFTEDELLAFVRAALIKRQARIEKQVRHKIRLVKPGIRESKSKFELNVPAGAFVSAQHAWARIELNGAVRIGLDDLIRKIFTRADRVDLPAPGKKISKGGTLFSVGFGDFSLDIPSPFSGTVISVNSEHADHPEWLAIKPAGAFQPDRGTAGPQNRSRRRRLVPGGTGPVQRARQERRGGRARGRLRSARRRRGGEQQ